MIYLDANASEPLRPEARAAALAAMGLGNPSSVHASGRAARAVLEDAREALAAYFHATPRDVIFCSGATEANALAIRALGAGRPVLVGATEHDAVRAVAHDKITVPVLADGTTDMAALARLLAAHPGALLCLMAANNETGVCHDIAGAAALCGAHGALLHVDAVQAACRAKEDWLGMGVASLAVSGHKMGGPPGAGALIVSRDREIVADLRGGGQEGRRRGGTQALPAIAGMAACLGGVYDAATIGRYRDEIELVCTGLGAVVMGVGMALLEQTVYDPRNGQPINGNLADYLVATCADAPEIDVTFLDYPDYALNSYGARGIGEIGLAGVAPAITAAVYHAT
ncbi:MAG: aminotransferase class V-fold PLP-dependent enzyme, partial [Acidocella sp.]|nr:aminotransferase class V-fold PLP-dependent enzyme [Acidocella sp.]